LQESIVSALVKLGLLQNKKLSKYPFPICTQNVSYPLPTVLTGFTDPFGLDLFIGILRYFSEHHNLGTKFQFYSIT